MNIYQIANQMKINHQTIYDINIRVAYYVRVSTLREQQDSSVDNQIIHFEKLIKIAISTLIVFQIVGCIIPTEKSEVEKVKTGMIATEALFFFLAAVSIRFRESL